MSKGLGADITTHKTQGELDADHWIQCDRCSKWRRVLPKVAEAIEDEAEWYCEHNPNSSFASCDVAQELTNEEIDQEAAEAEQERHNLPKLPAVWQLIRCNHYSHRKRKQQDEDDIMVCSCPPPWRGGDGCGPNCINRMLCIECTEDFCPCEDNCNNQMFTRKQYAKLAVRRAGPKGFGLYAEEDVKAGQFLIEYIGEVLEEEEYTRRKQYYIQHGQRHFYFMNIGNGEVIDACRKGNHARFINHSCEPNCETQKWMVQGELAIGLFTLRSVKAGEELTFDYNFERYGDKPMRCFCGSRKCRKFIGGTQESTADIVEVGDAEDVTNDPEPVMVREDETDATVQAMLDKEVGAIRRSWDTKMLSKLQQLCRQKGIDWSVTAEDAGRSASTQAPVSAAAPSSPSKMQSEDEDSRAVPAASKAAASPVSSSVPAVDTLGRVEVDGIESIFLHCPPKASVKQQKRKRAAQQAELDPAAAAKKQQQDERKRQRLEQQEKRKQKQQQEFLRMQAEAEQRFERMKHQRMQQQDQQQQPSRRKLIKQQQPPPQEEEVLPAEGEELRDSDMESEVEGERQEQQAAAAAAAVQGNEPSDRCSQKVRPVLEAAPAPAAARPVVHRRIKIVQSKRPRPPLAPGAKSAAAAASEGTGKEKKTPSGRRSFLTLTVSTAGKTLKRRSEVDRRLEQLVQKQSWKLKEPGQQSVIKVLRMFNLCDITPQQADPSVQQQAGSKQGSPVKQHSALSQPPVQQQQHSDATGSVVQPEGRGDVQIDQQQLGAAAASGEGGAAGDQLGQPQLPQSLTPLQPLRGAELEARERESEARFKARQRARMADLGMLLDVVLASSSEKLKKEWVVCGILTQLQQTLGRVPFTAEYSSVLVKVIRVLEHLPLTPDDLYTVRSAHGTFADLIRRMASSASDWEVRRRSHQLLKRYAAATCSDATLLQLYYVPGANGKPYLLSLHLPPPQIQRLLALLPKNAPPPRNQHQRWGDQSSGQGPGRVLGPGGPSPAADQHSSPSTSHGAGIAADGNANGSSLHWRLPQQQLQQQSEEVQFMQGNRPLGRGASSSQLANEGWEVGPPGGPWSDRPPPPVPPAGAPGVFRHQRRQMQQRSPVRPFGGRQPCLPDGVPARGFLCLDRGPDWGLDKGADRFDRVDGCWERGETFVGYVNRGSSWDRGHPFGPADGINGVPGGWHPPPGRDRACVPGPGVYGSLPGAGSESHPRDRDWELQSDWDRDRCDWDRDRCERGDSDRDNPDSRQARHQGTTMAPRHHYGLGAAGRSHRGSWDTVLFNRQQSPQPHHPSQQEQPPPPHGMPPISDLFADAPSGPLDGTGGAPETQDQRVPADHQPVHRSKGWQQHELQGGPSDGGKRCGTWENADQQGRARAPRLLAERCQGRQGDQGPSGVIPASIEDLYSLGVYVSHQQPGAVIRLEPARDPQAAQAAAAGSLSPIVSGRFSPPIAESLATSQRPSTPVLPTDSDLTAEDMLQVFQDAVVADKTPGVAVSTLVAADLASQQQQQQQQQSGKGLGAEACDHQPPHPGAQPQPTGPWDAVITRPLQPPKTQLNFRAAGMGGRPHPPLAHQQQKQQLPDSWQHPGPGFEAFVGEAVKHRLGKYVQPDHPNRISREEAHQLYRKLRREVVEKELTAFAGRQAQNQFKPIDKVEVEAKIKDFVRHSIRRLHASRAAGDQEGLAIAGFIA